jgi:hypothetical protein
MEGRPSALWPCKPESEATSALLSSRFYFAILKIFSLLHVCDDNEANTV